MKKTLIIAVCLMLFGSLTAQKIHSISEIIGIMDKSDVTYSLYEETFPATDFSQNVLAHGYYLADGENGAEVKKYEFEGEAAKEYEQAEDLFRQDEFEEARRHYQKVLEAYPACSQVMVYIGDTYYQLHQAFLARDWYEKAVAANYYDFLAHWALANACYANGDSERALKEITIAKVLNRNNPRLQQRLEAIYAALKKNYNNWVFDPAYRLSTEYNEEREKDVVQIHYTGDWLAYAVVKAVWQYEPGYAESMDNNAVLREKEAIAGMYTALDKKTLKKHIALRVFEKSVNSGQAGMVDYFVIFDCILPQHPEIIFELSEGDVSAIADYILNLRSTVKK